jgi:putative flippase GtrA
MDSEHRLLRHLATLAPRRRQVLRYSGVSVIATLTSLATLGFLVGVGAVGVVYANLIATAAGTVPSFELNRRWVWARTDGRSLRRQVIPFCALSFAGLVLSTVTVRVASTLSAHHGQFVHTGAVELANVGAYGSLWVAQFILLDRVLFARGPSRRGREWETGATAGVTPALSSLSPAGTEPGHLSWDGGDTPAAASLGRHTSR